MNRSEKGLGYKTKIKLGLCIKFGEFLFCFFWGVSYSLWTKWVKEASVSLILQGEGCCVQRADLLVISPRGSTEIGASEHASLNQVP